jgi:serine phosphatase RsbU (regulator of sigma subunit)
LEESKILIADDNLDMIYLIKKGFLEEGFKIIEAHDGDEAFEKIMRDKPDLILLDLKMPRKHGLEVLKEIKGTEELKDIPVIVLTVVSDTNEKLAALECGANDFLLKPPITAELKARVYTQLKLRNATQALKDYTHQLEDVVQIKTKELQDYAKRLEEMVEDKVGVIRRQHEEHMIDMKSAAILQRSLLPHTILKVKGLSFVNRYLPCDSIGGDFYNIFRIDEDTIGLFIADVSGHGIPSAMITVFLKQEISYHVKDVMQHGQYSVVRPKEVLRRLNRSFIANKIGEGAYFVTIVYCTYNFKEKELIVSLAGHHALPIIKRNNADIKTVELQGFPIGWFDTEEEYTEKRYKLEAGDSFFLYTDGLLDIVREASSHSSGNNIFEPVFNLFEKEDVAGALDGITREYRKSHGHFEDDITLLSMKVADHK